jgi:hypothetical protein
MKFQKKDFPLLQSGMLVEVIEAADQSYFTKTLVGKIGLVVKNIEAKSSPNIWEVLIEEKTFNLHALDLKVLE